MKVEKLIFPDLQGRWSREEITRRSQSSHTAAEQFFIWWMSWQHDSTFSYLWQWDFHSVLWFLHIDISLHQLLTLILEALKILT